MKKLTIEGKTIPVWMETQVDVDRAVQEYAEACDRNYVHAKDLDQVRTCLACGLVPVFTCPIEEVESAFLMKGQPVLFCIEKSTCKIGTVNPLKHKLAHWHRVYRGMVAYGESPNLFSGERSVWGIPHHHSMNFAEFGYS
jgi:hypothetical protein